MAIDWMLNTSNPGKMKEFQRLFANHGIALTTSQVDLEEIDADPLTVVVHKASQLKEGILVEDTSLEIEEESVGVHIRWLLQHLGKYVGKKAVWRVLLACQKHGQVHVYEGKIQGTIVQPRGEGGFGFDPFFLPDNSTFTLAESKPDSVNARAKVVEALLRENVVAILPPLKDWNGSWQ
jgi:XTP/dITP diphosphohydrolase